MSSMTSPMSETNSLSAGDNLCDTNDIQTCKNKNTEQDLTGCIHEDGDNVNEFSGEKVLPLDDDVTQTSLHDSAESDDQAQLTVDTDLGTEFSHNDSDSENRSVEFCYTDITRLISPDSIVEGAPSEIDSSADIQVDCQSEFSHCEEEGARNVAENTESDSVRSNDCENITNTVVADDGISAPDNLEESAFPSSEGTSKESVVLNNLNSVASCDESNTTKDSDNHSEVLDLSKAPAESESQQDRDLEKEPDDCNEAVESNSSANCNVTQNTCDQEINERDQTEADNLTVTTDVCNESNNASIKKTDSNTERNSTIKNKSAISESSASVKKDANVCDDSDALDMTVQHNNSAESNICSDNVSSLNSDDIVISNVRSSAQTVAKSAPENNTVNSGSKEGAVRAGESLPQRLNSAEQQDLVMVRHTQRANKRKNPQPMCAAVEVQVKQEKLDDGYEDQMRLSNGTAPLVTIHHSGFLPPSNNPMNHPQSRRHVAVVGGNGRIDSQKLANLNTRNQPNPMQMGRNQAMPALAHSVGSRSVQMSNGALVVVPGVNNGVNVISSGKQMVNRSRENPLLLVVSQQQGGAVPPEQINSNMWMLQSNDGVISNGLSANKMAAKVQAQKQILIQSKTSMIRQWLLRSSHPLGKTRLTTSPPPELHLESSVPDMLRRCGACGDQFITQAGFEDHMNRRSIYITFQCRCERSPASQPHVFYNHCAYVMFHKKHVMQCSAGVAKGVKLASLHSPVECCQIKSLPTSDMSKEYQESLKELEEKAASKVTSDAVNVRVTGSNEQSGTAEAVDSNTEQCNGSLNNSVEIIDNNSVTVEDLNTKEVSASQSSSTITACSVNDSDVNTATTPATTTSLNPAIVTQDKESQKLARDEVDQELEERVTELSGALSRRQARCTECHRGYNIPSLLAMHFSRQNNNISGASLQQLKLCCQHCGMVLPNRCSYTAHLRLHGTHTNVDWDSGKVDAVGSNPPFVCPECGVCFEKNSSVFVKHLNQVCLHFSRYTEFKCPICSHQLRPRVDVVLKHIIDKHATTYSKCSLCPMAFSSCAAYEKHSIERHNGTSISKVIGKCPICDKVLSSVQDLRAHVTQHIQQFKLQARILHQYRCSSCKELFSNKRALCDHMRAHHSDSMVRGIMCDCCGEAFDGGNVQSHLIHLIKEHPEYTQSIIMESKGEPVTNNSAVMALDDEAANQSEERSEATESEAVSDEVQKFLCERCQISFTSEKLWRRHNAKHQFIAGQKRSQSSDTPVESEEKTGGREGREGCTKMEAEEQGAGDGAPHVGNSAADLVDKKPMERLGVVIKVATGRRREGNRIVGVRSLSDVRKSKKPRERKNSNQARTTPSPGAAKMAPDAPKYVKAQVPTAAPDLRFRCTMCEARFSCNTEVCMHLESAHALARWFPCQLCEVSCRDEQLLAAHVRDKHTSSKQSSSAFICWICKEQSQVKGYPRRRLLVKHLKNVHKLSRSRGVDVNDLITQHCGTAESQEESGATTECDQVRRLRVIGESGGFVCSHCQFSTNTRDDFSTHIAQHKHDDMSVQCAECGTCVSVLPALRRHLFIVHRVRDFSQYTAETGVNLDPPSSGSSGDEERPDPVKASRKRSRSPASQSEEACVLVKRAVVVVSNKLNVERKTEPSEPDKEIVKENKFECNVCYKTFDDVNAHRSHMRVHGMAFIQRTRRSLSQKEHASDSSAANKSLTAAHDSSEHTDSMMKVDEKHSDMLSVHTTELSLAQEPTPLISPCSMDSAEVQEAKRSSRNHSEDVSSISPSSVESSSVSERSCGSSVKGRVTRRSTRSSDMAAIFGENSVDSYGDDSYKQLKNGSSEFTASACAV